MSIVVLVCSAGCAVAQNGDERREVERETQAHYDSLLHTYYVKKYSDLVHNRYQRNDMRMESLAQTPDSVLQQRLEALPTVIPMTYNAEVRSYIEMYMRIMGRQLDVILSLSEFYFPMFEEVLDRYGLPLELKYLTIVESALNPRVTSRAGAAGLWQFMYQTGRTYGLEVNSLVDERRDPYLSTVAAARYLRDLHKIFGDWPLALAAYNCGPGGVNKALARSGGKHDFWQIYNYLPRETRHYIPAFIAVNYVMNYYYLHGLHPQRVEIPVHTDTVQLRSDALYCHIAQYADVEVDEIRELNPQYRTDLVPASSGFRKVLLPMRVIPKVIEMEDSICNATRDSLQRHPVTITTTAMSDRVVYKVRKGDTMGKIARKYGVTEQEIKRWNKKKSTTLREGERLVIYRKGAPAAATTGSSGKGGTSSKAAATTGNASSTVHTVAKGETLGSIAKKYGTTVAAIKKKNALTSDNIRVGQKLKMP